MTRGLFLADPRVEPADLACGFAFFKLTAAYRRALIVMPASRGPDPRIRPAGPKIIEKNLPLPARKPLSSPGDTPVVSYHSVQKYYTRK